MRQFKVQKSKIRVSLVLIVIGLSALLMLTDKASAELTMKANHDHITIDFFYHGSTVGVSGVSDPGTDLVIKIASPEGHQALRKKGKIAGFLWMNVGTLTFEDTPSLYLLTSTKKMEDILSKDELDNKVMGYQALANHVRIEPVTTEDEKAKWFDQFVKFKESSSLYSVSSGNISVNEKGGKQNYYVMMGWPYQAAPGEYTVTVYAVRDKKVVETASQKVFVEQVGIIKSLAGMAKSNAAVYGIISIIAALGAGFGVGLVFRKGGGAH